jgi:hypothetical protein
MATTATTPHELATRLDAASMFLQTLGASPQFAGRRDGLEGLWRAIGDALGDLCDREGVDPMQVEDESYEWLAERGLVDPGVGVDAGLVLLGDQLAGLASMFGVEWDRDVQEWVTA